MRVYIMYKIIIKNNLLPPIRPPPHPSFEHRKAEKNTQSPRGEYKNVSVCLCLKIHLPRFVCVYVFACELPGKTLPEESPSPSFPISSCWEQENIEYKISYFIINIPFSVSPGRSSRRGIILPVCSARRPRSRWLWLAAKFSNQSPPSQQHKHNRSWTRYGVVVVLFLCEPQAS